MACKSITKSKETLQLSSNSKKLSVKICKDIPTEKKKGTKEKIKYKTICFKIFIAY